METPTLIRRDRPSLAAVGAGQRGHSDPAQGDCLRWRMQLPLLRNVGCSRVPQGGRCGRTFYCSSAMKARRHALIEVGAALAAGKQVFLVSPDWWSLGNHPLCRLFETIEDAVSAICAL